MEGLYNRRRLHACGREITKEEARQILERAEEDGLVHHSSNHLGKKVFICTNQGISLARRPGDKASPIFSDGAELLQTVARDKNKQYPFE